MEFWSRFRLGKLELVSIFAAEWTTDLSGVLESIRLWLILDLQPFILDGWTPASVRYH